MSSMDLEFELELMESNAGETIPETIKVKVEQDYDDENNESLTEKEISELKLFIANNPSCSFEQFVSRYDCWCRLHRVVGEENKKYYYRNVVDKIRNFIIKHYKDIKGKISSKYGELIYYVRKHDPESLIYDQHKSYLETDRTKCIDQLIQAFNEAIKKVYAKDLKQFEKYGLSKEIMFANQKMEKLSHWPKLLNDFEYSKDMSEEELIKALKNKFFPQSSNSYSKIEELRELDKTEIIPSMWEDESFVNEFEGTWDKDEILKGFGLVAVHYFASELGNELHRKTYPSRTIRELKDKITDLNQRHQEAIGKIETKLKKKIIEERLEKIKLLNKLEEYEK